jgi:protein TonB
MTRRTIILIVIGISMLLHGSVGIGLFAAAQLHGDLRRAAIAVQVAEEKKKKAKPPAPKPPPPKPTPRKVASIPKAEPAPVAAPKAAVAKAAPVAMPIQMSNESAPPSAYDSSPGGVVIPTARPAAAKPAAARTVAGIGQDGPKRLKRDLGGAPDETPCSEEPSKPEPVFKTEIEYTAQARAENIEGKLKLRLVVGRDGSVVQVDVLASVSPELDAAAVEAAKKWRFTPAMACGKPVDGGTYILARKFELGD